MSVVKSGFDLIKESFKGWKDDGALDLGAALAYYTIFSLAPLLLIVIAVAGLVFGARGGAGADLRPAAGLVGAQGAEAIQTHGRQRRQARRGRRSPRSSAW